MMFMLMVSILMSIEDDKLFFMGKVPRKQTLWWVKGRGEEGHEKNEKIADSPQFAPDSQVSIPNRVLGLDLRPCKLKGNLQSVTR